MNRALLACVLLVACGKGDDDDPGPFDLDDYCQQTADCYNDFFDAYAADTGYRFVLEPETCVQQWETAQEQYAEGPCSTAYQTMEDCITTAEHLVCVRGSYGSGACTVEALDFATCLSNPTGATR